MSAPNAAEDEVFHESPVAAPQEDSSAPTSLPPPENTADTAAEESTCSPVPPTEPHPSNGHSAERLGVSPPATSSMDPDAALVEGVDAAVREGAAENKGEAANDVDAATYPVAAEDATSFTSAAAQTTVQAHEGKTAAALDALEADRLLSPLAFTETQGVDSVEAQEAAVPSTSPLVTAVAAAEAVPSSAAWVVDFGSIGAKPKRKMTKKEKDAIKTSRLRSQQSPAANASGMAESAGAAPATGLGADSEGNAVQSRDAPLQLVQLDGLADRAALIPTDLTTTRADLEQRLVLRLPRLLCVNKQYPRGCGIASLTSVYNYLYSWLGESEVGAERAPHSQEEMMSILGFEPPFGEIAWGPFTGNVTLIRWFHALNRHFGLRGRAYILYKAHGHGKTTHLYPDNAAALVAVKAALRDPHCALIYHCHNHYMVPIGYQEIPQAQTDFLKPAVPETSTDTTIFIGEVSRGRHEAMYARKWDQIVKDIECQSPFFFNIRHPEQGVQRREPKKKKAPEASPAATEDEAAGVPGPSSAGDNEAITATTAAAAPAESAVAMVDNAVDVVPSVTAPAPAEGAAEPSIEVLDAQGDAEPAEPPASPVTNAGDLNPLPELPPVARSTDATPLPPPSSEAAIAGPRRAARPPFGKRPLMRPPPSATSLLSQQQQPQPSSSLSAAKPKPERGNLHCLIIFRNDQAEEHLGRYEDDVEDRADGVLRGSSASSSSDGSSSSDEGER